MKIKIRIIINPKSGSGRRKKVLRMINRHLDRTKFDCQIVRTEYHQHAIELTQQAVADGCQAVVIAGGDGSVNQVGGALVKTKVALGILPSGSGNGLARSLGIPLDMKEAVLNLNNFIIRTIDTGLANGNPYMNVAGVGFAAAVADGFHKAKFRGLFKYFIMGFKYLRVYKMQSYKVEVDGRSFERRAHLISLPNSSQYGSNAIIAPKALMDDGLLDAVIINPFPKYLLLSMFYRLFISGTLDKSPYIKTFKFKKMTITQQRNDIAHLDGEPTELGKIVEIEVNPMSLSVIVGNE